MLLQRSAALAGAEFRVPASNRHEIGLIIAAPMPERLERGFFPEIPCTMYISAFNRENRKHYYSIIFEAQPFSSLRDSLAAHLRDAGAELDRCAPDFISAHGKPDHTA